MIEYLFSRKDFFFTHKIVFFDFLDIRFFFIINLIRTEMSDMTMIVRAKIKNNQKKKKKTRNCTCGFEEEER